MASNSGFSETPNSSRPSWSATNKSSHSTSARRKLFENNSDHSNTQKSLSWITRDDNDELQVSSLDHLHPDISARKFVNFVSIVGPARQGKSFLMNSLIGEDVFGTADTMSVCTKGAQVANVVEPKKSAGCILFVDTEGQGDQDVDSDTTLLTPVLLLSKVVLFNWKGGLQKNQILNELAILVEVGNCVSANSFDEGTAKFGHLHIVLRDFHFQGTADDAYNKIFEPEEKRGEKIKERNKIREKLLSSFESVDVSIFPAPCDTSNEEIRHLDVLETSEEFQESVRQLKKKILEQTGEPRYFGSAVVHSENANFFVEKFIEELQEGDVVHLKSAVAQFQKGIVDVAKRFFEEALVEAYKNVDVPVRDGIEGILTRQKDVLLDAFEELTAKVDVATTYRDEVLEGLEEFSDREVEATSGDQIKRGGTEGGVKHSRAGVQVGR